MATANFSLPLVSQSLPSSYSSTQSKLSTSFIPNASRAFDVIPSSVKTAKSRFMNKCLRAKPMHSFTCSASYSPATLSSALLFDCDGVLVDTEKDGHRISFNDTFKERELGVNWDVDLYDELLKIGGGKERYRL